MGSSSDEAISSGIEDNMAKGAVNSTESRSQNKIWSTLEILVMFTLSVNVQVYSRYMRNYMGTKTLY